MASRRRWRDAQPTLVACGQRIRGDTNKNNAERDRLLQAHNEAERLLREQKLQLDAALNNMLQGLCMFDADEKIVCSISATST